MNYSYIILISNISNVLDTDNDIKITLDLCPINNLDNKIVKDDQNFCYAKYNKDLVQNDSL